MSELTTAQWRKIADKLYTEIVRDWCWHCGADRNGNCYTDEVIQEYRNAVMDEYDANE